MGKKDKLRKHYYAVAIGRCPPSIFTTWDEANFMTSGYHGNMHKGFDTFEKAKKWLLRAPNCATFHCQFGLADGPKSKTNENGGKPEIYVVFNGRKPGLYNSYDEVKLQVEGHNHASHKSFATLNTAEQAYRDKKWPGRKDHQSTDSESYDGSDNGDKDDLVTMMRRTKLED